MEITIMGYALIPLGLILLFFNIDYLFIMIMFFSGFSGSSVINFTSIEFSLQPSYYFAAIYLFKYLFVIVRKSKIIKPNIFLFGFITVSFISLIMPIVLKDKDILVMNVDGIIEPLKFTKGNLTQFIYLLFCFFVYWFVEDRLNHKPGLIRKGLKAYFMGSFVICILGIYQLICNELNLPFDEIFRSGVHNLIQKGRMWSVASEPSMFAFYIVPTMALLIFSNNIINDTKQKILILILFISGILSTSSTFLFGVLVFVLLFIKRNFIKLNFTKRNLKYIKWFSIVVVFSISLLSIIIYNNEFINEVLIQGTIDKILMKNASGIERSESFLLMINAAFASPILGLGFGSSRSKDLFSTWLANTGIIGFGLFILYIMNIYRNLNKIYKFSSISILEGYMYFIAILVLCAFVSVPEPYFLFIWTNFALAEVYISISRSENFDK